MNLSYWEQSEFFDKIDIAIIGSGIVGLNAAIHLKEKYPKRNIAILERGSIPSGASTRNAGVACFGSVTELTSDFEKMGLDTVLELVERRWKGLEKLRQRVGDQNLELQYFGGYELFLNHKEYETYTDKIDFWNTQLAPIIGTSNIFSTTDNKIKDFGFQQVKHLVFNAQEGQINTGKMMKTLLKIARQLGVEIYNGITVQDFKHEEQGVRILMKNGWQFFTDKLLIATNGFTKRLIPEMEVKPARNQVFITEPIPNMLIQGTFHYDSGYYYFRNIGHRLLMGGGRNLALEAETIDEFGFTAIIQNRLIELTKEIILPNHDFKIERWWSGILGVGNTKKPILQLIDDRIGLAVRLGGMGVAIGSLVGQEAAEMMSHF
jgi:glycine/D-amino acid oxidase-like deaminating enzyme